MSTGFISDTKLIREDSRVDDLFSLQNYQTLISKKINNLPSGSILAIVGSFGCGKSTLIHQIRKSSDPAKGSWIEFDAWKYPERKEMWEGLILDTAEQLGNRKAIAGKIEGKSTKSKILDLVTDLAGAISELPGFDMVDKFVEIFKTSPATRVFELQSIFTKLLEKNGKDTVFVLEDIDRSGGHGIFFLETLSQFLRTVADNSENKIVAVVLIADTSYESDINSYRKSIDYFEKFNPTNLDFTKFVDTVFVGDFFTGEEKRGHQTVWTGVNRRSQIISFFGMLVNEYPDTNLRTIKMILRKANAAFQEQQADGLDPDFRVTLCFEAAKFFKSNDPSQTFFEKFRKDGVVSRGNIFSTFLFSMLNNYQILTNRNHETNRHV